MTRKPGAHTTQRNGKNGAATVENNNNKKEKLLMAWRERFFFYFLPFAGDGHERAPPLEPTNQSVVFFLSL